MKYHDSISKAEQILALSVEQCKQWSLPVNPINYSVAYEYHKKSIPKLNHCIDTHLKSSPHLSDFFMESLFTEHVLEQSKFRDEIISDLSKLLAISQKSYQVSSSSAQCLIEQVDEAIPQLDSEDKNTVANAISSLKSATQTFKEQQASINKQLESAQKQNEKLSKELAEVRKEMNIDPVTGLFNEKSIKQHIKNWRQQNDKCNITVILVRINHFYEFNREFGNLLADVILTKVASKVASYADDSGLPARLSFDELILLLPNVENDIANEIGKKMTLGVEKLRFVSAKSRVRLPRMSINFATDILTDESIDTFIAQTRKKLPAAKALAFEQE